MHPADQLSVPLHPILLSDLQEARHIEKVRTEWNQQWTHQRESKRSNQRKIV